MKFVTLLLYQYSKYFVKEIILFLQVLILIVVGYIASNNFIITYQINNCAESVYSKELVFFNIHGRIIDIIEGFAGFDESEGIRLNNEIRDSIMQFSNVRGIGEIGSVVYRNTDNSPVGGIAYNSDLIKNTTINLRQGNWHDLLYESEYIPINNIRK